ncbi:hypothetical protein Trydic_g21420 [Trypoxylus dichotomus]
MLSWKQNIRSWTELNFEDRADADRETFDEMSTRGRSSSRLEPELYQLNIQEEQIEGGLQEMEEQTASEQDGHAWTIYL